MEKAKCTKHELYKKNYNHVFRYFQTKTSCIETARDLTHDTFVKIYERGKIDGLTYSDQKRYLQIAAKNRLVDYYKQVEKQNLYVGILHTQCILDHSVNDEQIKYSNTELYDRIADFFSRLTGREQEVFYYKYCMNETITTICLKLRISRYKIDQILTKLLEKIESQLGDYTA
jgi:RNA polymerase sigma factor (sigma-70 family)